MARIVLATFGSYGDVLPFVVISKRLAARGHTPVIAAPATYRDLVSRHGIAFAAVRPDVDLEDPHMLERAMDPKKGTEFVVRELLAPAIRNGYEDISRACEGADLATSHTLTHAVPMVGELTGMRWVSTVLMPMVFCSAHDPPALAPIPWFANLRVLGPVAVGAIWKLFRRLGWSWSEPIREFRRELGLDASVDPLWEGQFSPHGVVALFSSTFAERQPDWPERTTICGFPDHDVDFGENPDAERLESFLEDGPEPIVFSLGSSAAGAAGDFFEVATAAARRMGRRAVIVDGRATATGPALEGVLAIRSAPLHRLFESAAAIVHAGGIGTIGLALRAGRPQVVIPFSHDQFDNAARIARHGAGAKLGRRGLTAARLARRLEGVLGDAKAIARAATMAERIRSEDGVGAACDALERAVEGDL